MRSVVLALAVAAAASLAFAPAPFPRAERARKQQDDLQAMQGVWLRVTHNGQPARGDVVEVKGDVWRANVPGDSWTMKLDQTARPRRIDIIRVGQPGNFFLGVYKLEGDVFTYSLRQYATEAARPLDFEPHNPWVSVFERRRP
jgi:uncharacterized protein (TIGR03067 family)